MAALVAACDARGRLSYTNPALQAILPPTRGADRGVSSGAAASLPAPLDALPLRWAALTGTQHRDVIVQLRGPDRVERRTTWTVTPVRTADGAVRGAVAVGHDVTAEQAQAQAQEDALTAAAHDLRSPLTTILGNLQLAHRTVAAWTQPPVLPHGGDSARSGRGEGQPVTGQEAPVARLIRYLEVAETGARELICTMDTLLDASATAAGTLVQQLEPDGVDLGVVTQQAVDHARTLSTRHVITLVVRQHSLLVAGDRVRLRQVLDNLLANAVKYAPDGGPIVVHLTAVATIPVGDDGEIKERAAAPAPQGSSDTPSWAVLRVADTGLGIPAADVPHVFERHRRAGGATRLIHGTGLGLYTSRAIVAAHGGHLWVERTAVAPEIHAGPAQPQQHRAAPSTSPSEQEAGWHGTVMALALPLVSPAAEEGADANGEALARAAGGVDGRRERTVV